jgi:hypothetical protein
LGFRLELSFTEEAGEKGRLASTVHLITGLHYLRLRPTGLALRRVPLMHPDGEAQGTTQSASLRQFSRAFRAF